MDYPLFIRPVAEAVARGEFDRGIVLGGSGNGEAIVANRVKGIRCALCWNADSARLARQHNDANVLSLGQRMMSLETALQIVQIWLETPFEGGRHQRRIDLIDGSVLCWCPSSVFSLPGLLESVRSLPTRLQRGIRTILQNMLLRRSCLPTEPVHYTPVLTSPLSKS